MDFSQNEVSPFFDSSSFDRKPEEGAFPVVCRNKLTQWFNVAGGWAIVGFCAWASTLPNNSTAPNAKAVQYLLCFGTAGTFTLYAIWLTFELIRAEIRADQTGLRWRHALSGWKQVHWGQITDYYLKTSRNGETVTKIVETRVGKLKLESSFAGIERVAELVAQKATQTKRPGWQDQKSNASKAWLVSWKEPLLAGKRFRLSPQLRLKVLLKKITILFLSAPVWILLLNARSPKKVTIGGLLDFFWPIYVLFAIVLLGHSAALWVAGFLESTYVFEERGVVIEKAGFKSLIRWSNITRLEIVPHPTLADMSFVRFAWSNLRRPSARLPLPVKRVLNFLRTLMGFQVKEELAFKTGQIDTDAVLELYQRYGPQA